MSRRVPNTFHGQNADGRWKQRKQRRTIVSAGASATISSHSSVSLGSGATTLGGGAHHHGGWGGWSSVLPNEDQAIVVTDPSKPKLALEHRNRVLAKLVDVLGLRDPPPPKAECLRRAREIETRLHADCVAKRDYKLGAVERILLIERNDGHDPVDDSAEPPAADAGADSSLVADKEGNALGARRKRRKKEVAVGVVVAASSPRQEQARKQASVRAMPKALRQLAGEKPKRGERRAGRAKGGGQGVVPTVAPAAAAAVAMSGGIGADARAKAVSHLTNALAGEADGDARAATVASEVEEALFSALVLGEGGAGPQRRKVAVGAGEYRRQLRAILFNLRASDDDATPAAAAVAAGAAGGKGVGAESLVLSSNALAAHGYPAEGDGAWDAAQGWRTTPASGAGAAAGTAAGGGSGLLGMACETVGTAAGTALARVSMVDSGGETVLDMLVKPPDAVTDYRTQRSGITEGLLRHITSTLADAQRAVCGLLKPDAAGGAPILAGHELSNDLRALRLVHHGRVIDTAVLFPQQSLESLASSILGTAIQSADDGHDTLEDTQAAVRLAQLRMRYGDDDAALRSHGRSQHAGAAAASDGAGAAAGEAGTLRAALLSGALSAAATPYLSGAELASAAVREANRQIDQSATTKRSFQKVMPEPGLFACEKCGSDRVRHTTAQIQRGDEAETVFLTCFNCDHKWAEDRGF